MLENVLCLMLMMAANQTHFVFAIGIPSNLPDAVFHIAGSNNEQIYHDRATDPGKYDPLVPILYSLSFEDL
jgi:hypothetical protein